MGAIQNAQASRLRPTTRIFRDVEPVTSPGLRTVSSDKVEVTNAPKTGLAPAEFVETLVVDAEVVGDLVHNSGNDFVHHFFVSIADRTDRPPVDEDAIRQFTNTVILTFSERNAVIEPQNVGVFTVVFDQENDVVDECEEVLRDQIDGFAHQHFETLF